MSQINKKKILHNILNSQFNYHILPAILSLRLTERTFHHELVKDDEKEIKIHEKFI